MPTTLEGLSSISQILSAAYHRNKNQHRLAKWWKAFSMLRRNVSKLITSLEALTSNEEELGKTRKTTTSRGLVEQRVEFMVRWLVPKCFLAFSALVADNQFANLGLMLMGTLARLRKIIQPFCKVQDEKEDVDMTMDESLVEQNELDLGEVISRKEPDIDASERGGQEADGEVDVEPEKGEKHEKKRSVGMEEFGKELTIDSTPSKPRKKRRKKGGDEFDDLFGSLLS